MKKHIFTLILILSALVGLFAVNVFADEDTPELDITGANLVFSENTHLLFAVDIENASYEEVELLIFKGDGINVSGCIKGNEILSLRTSGTEVNEGNIRGCVYEYTDLMAAEFTENIYARAYFKDGADEYYSDVVKYSVLQYACNKLGVTGTATKNEKLRSMLEYLLAYGASAQDYFGVNTGRLATDDYVKYYFEGALLPDGMSYGLFKKGERITANPIKSASKSYTMWRDSNGTSIAKGDTLSIIADRNRTVIAEEMSDEPTFGSYKYVVIIGVDGAGSFYPDETDTPNIDRIFSDGAITHTMRVTSPTASSVSWTSCLHGVQPENHGNLENAAVEAGSPYPMNSKYPSILRVVKEARPSAEVACFYAWSGINGIVESSAGINKQKKGDAAIVEYLESGYLKSYKPTLTYLHFNNPDSVGHNFGHHTDAYYSAIETIDSYVGRIYNAYKSAGMIDDTLFIVTADHGGINQTHGGLKDCEKYVLFAAAGKNVTNTEIEDMYIRDTSAIVLHALGIEQPMTYTASIPIGIFPDVTSCERFEYHDPDLPRYHLPVSTPVEGEEGYVTEFIDKDLAVYLPFDGNSADLMGHNVEENGKLTYEDGYFGKGIRLDDGYLNLEDFKLGTGSYTISMWVKSSTPTNGFSPIITNKRASMGNDGFMFAIGRYASVERQDHYTHINVAKAGKTAEIKENMPSDYIYGWMHITLVLDRENGLLCMSYDFGDFYTVDLPSSLSSGVSLSTAYNYLTLGEAADGAASYKSGFAIDEFMIFEGAFDSDDMRALVSYYGADAEIKNYTNVTNAFRGEKKPEVYFGFNENAGNLGTSPVSVGKSNTVTYNSGKSSSAALFGESFNMNVEGLKLGTESFSVATWLCAADLSDEPDANTLFTVISNSAGIGRANHGFNVYVDTESEKLVATVGQLGKGVEGSVDFPNDVYLGKWTHIAVVYDRDESRLVIYVDFKKALDIPLNYCSTDVSVEDTLSCDTSYPIRIGNLGNPSSKYAFAGLIDDFMLFGRALSDSDIVNISQYYKEPLSVYIDKTPSLNFNFNGDLDNRGDFDGAVIEMGSVGFAPGYIGSGATFENGSVDIPEMNLGIDKSFTFSFFINTDSLRIEEGEGSYLNIFSNGYKDNRSNEEVSGNFFSIALDREQCGIYVITNTESGNLGYALASCEGVSREKKWLRVTVVVNRNPDDGREYLEVYFGSDKAELEVTNMYAFGINDFNGSEGYTPHIGQDGTGKSEYPYSECLDELMLFDCALSKKEIAAIGAYYNQ